MEISLISFGSSQTFPLPHFKTDAARRFCNFRDEAMEGTKDAGANGESQEKKFSAKKFFARNSVGILFCVFSEAMEEDEWVIERVLKKRARHTCGAPSLLGHYEKEYLIKWEGYTDEYNQWCTEDELVTMYGELKAGNPDKLSRSVPRSTEIQDSLTHPLQLKTWKRLNSLKKSKNN